MAKRQKINISKKAYFIAIAAVLVFSIAANVLVGSFAPHYAHHLRFLGNAVTITYALFAAYRLMSAGYPSWLSYLIPIFFLLVVPFIAIFVALAAGIRSVDPRFELVVIVSGIYTIIFLIIVGLVPNKEAGSPQQIDRNDPHNRIEPRF
jgi:hypothetical protein